MSVKEILRTSLRTDPVGSLICKDTRIGLPYYYDGFKMGSQNKDCHHRNTRTYGTRLVSPNGIIVCRSLFLHHSLTRLSPFISFPPYLLPPSWCTSYSE